MSRRRFLAKTSIKRESIKEEHKEREREQEATFLLSSRRRETQKEDPSVSTLTFCS